MKQYLRTFLLILLILAMLPINTLATTDRQEAENIIYLDDGCYIIVELLFTESRVSGTKTGSKTYTYYGSDDVELWRAVLRGTFTYTGTSSTCTAVSCDITISNSSWYIVSKTTSKSAGSAIGELTMGLKFLGITIDKETVNMRITCDANGNLS